MSPCIPLVHLPAGGDPAHLMWVKRHGGARGSGGHRCRRCRRLKTGEDGRGFGLPLCRAVVSDPAGAFILTTAERGGWAAPAATYAVDRCSGTEGVEVFGLPPCRAVARDPRGSLHLPLPREAGG